MADGEQYFHEEGKKWVDPVEYYELQDVNRTDLQRSYDEGDIDVNKIFQKKGKKIYGLRLKPFAGAVWAEAIFKAVDKDVTSSSIAYQSLYGVKGIPLHEAGFCIYADEGVSRTYDFPYKYKLYYEKKTRSYTDDYTGKANISITGLHLSPTATGVGLSYAFSSNASEECYSNGRRKGKMKIKFNKQAGVDNKFGKFIYFRGGRDLIVMLSGKPELKKSPTIDLLNRPFARVYFIVEQVLVEDDEEPVVPLTAEDKQELTNYVSDLISWLRGDGDPLGLGEHSDAKTAAVINSIATVAAILSGGVIGGFIGGSGAQIAANITDTIINASGGDFPPPDYPNLPETDGTEPKRDDEDDKPQPDSGNGGDGNPPTDDGKGDFNSGPYSKLFNQYVKTDADGDITVKDPITGQDTIYINNGDGTYKNLTTGQDWTPNEIGERLDYKVENSETLSKDAATAKSYLQKNQENWNKKLEETYKRGYSDEMKDYQDYVKAQENQLKREEMLDKLFDKYHVYDGDVGHLKEVMLNERDKNSELAQMFIDKDKSLEKWQKAAEFVDKGCDTVLYTMGKCVPGGAYVYDGYVLTRAVGIASQETALSNDKGWDHIGRAVAKGGMAIIQNHASGIAGGLTGATGGAAFTATEFIVFTAPEAVTGGLNAIEHNKNFVDGAIDGVATKSMAYFTNKGLGKLGDGAAGKFDKLKFLTKSREVNGKAFSSLSTLSKSGLNTDLSGKYTISRILSTSTTKITGHAGGYSAIWKAIKGLGSSGTSEKDFINEATKFKK